MSNGAERNWSLATRLFRAGAAAQVGFDLQLRAPAKAGAIDLQVLHDALDIVARLGDRDALDPVDRVDLGIARVTMIGHPFLDPAAAGIVSGERHDIGPAVVLESAGNLGGAHLHVVNRVGHQPVHAPALTCLTNQSVVVEASTNLVNWQPIWTNTTSDASADFVDLEGLNYPHRFYRARSN